MSLNALIASAEAVPFAKVGGMADVVGSLPAALRRQGVDARVILPGYGFIEHFRYEINLLFEFSFSHRLGSSDVKVFHTVYDGVPYYFLQSWPYFGNDATVYTEWDWDVPRFIYFNQMIMAAVWELRQRTGWFPDILHANDWHSGLLPFLLYEHRFEPEWSQVASVLNIHNLAYQGDHAGGFLYMAGIHGRHHPELVYRDLTDNLMAIAIAYSDALITVSPRYATEIRYPDFGYGLNDLINARQDRLRGILNGIDTDLWNPETDPDLHAKFDATNFEERRPPNKTFLQHTLGLPQNPDVPVIGIVSRLVQQKGIDLLVPAIRRLLSEQDVQFVALGTGEHQFEDMLREIGYEFGWRGARIMLQYNDAVAQHIYAGSDMFLMPSHFEPCGTGQMLALRYGSLPLVRETGGLADTVQNYDNGNADYGNGFSFLWEESDALYQTLVWAVDTYRHRQSAWRRMQKRGMETDFSWRKSASEYIEMYEVALRHRRG